MPRYFFHVDSEPASRDETGEEVADAEGARALAIRYAGALLADMPAGALRSETTLLRLRVTDASDHDVLLVEVSLRGVGSLSQA